MTDNLESVHDSTAAAPRVEPATTRLDLEATDVGSVFVSNYPPYSFWSPDNLAAAERALDEPPRPETPLGLYLHIPFCRKRCKFCYFRVYTDKSADQIQGYLDAVAREVERYAERQALAGRPLHFVYFGGGTPSYIAVKHLLPLVERLKAAMPWAGADEVAFECEPGTLTRPKLEALREVGITRLSLGIENFNDAILEENGRAHLSEEIERVRPWIRELAFPQLNIDLIAGMVGETWDSWRQTVEKTLDYDPDSITLYQMELPFNTVYSKGRLRGEGNVEFADWKTKREWHAYAFERFEAAGYELSSAYTVVKKGRGCRFVYRDALWRGADMIGVGVSSISHLSGVHFQNVDGLGEYVSRIENNQSAVHRALSTSADERLVRELVLQLKTGHLDCAYFRQKFETDVLDRFGDQFQRLADQELAELSPEAVDLTIAGLLRVDQLLPEFYADQYRGARYT